MNIGHTARRTPNGAAFRAVALVATALGLAVCNGPTGEGEDGPALTLSLGEPGVYEYDFDGNPVTVLLACADTVRYGTIRWYADSSAAVDRIGSARADDKVVGAMVRMWWTGYPKLLDSASRVRYDTVFARAETPDGRLLTSNVVRVNIRNMAPRVDSIAVGDTVLHNRDSVYAVDIGESTAVHIRIYGRDADKDQFHVDWFPESDNVEELTADGRLIRYTAPGRLFRDTLTAYVVDNRGAQLVRRFILYHLPPNNLPVIDSMRVGAVRYAAPGAMISYTAAVIDSLAVTIWFHDQDRDSLTLEVTAGSGTVWGATVQDGNRRWFTCAGSGCGDSLVDDWMPVDTLTITVTDARNGSDVVRLGIFHGEEDETPVFGALSVNNDIYVDDIPLFTYDALGGEVLVIRIEATDPDTPDSLLTYSYESALGRQITVDDEGYARYTCLGTLYCDTITCGVSDGRTAAWKDLAVCVYDNAPRIDSMVVEQNGGRVRFTGSDTLFSLRTEKNAVVAITPHVTDRDQQDTLTRSWSSRRGVEFLFNGGQALYHAFNQPFRDTVVFSVTDRFGVKAADSLQITANEIPVIDSVRVLSSADTVTFVASNSRFEYYTDGDSLGFHVFGSDRDHIDLTFIWQHKGFYIDTVAPKTGQYRMYFDGSQTDTVIVKAFDAIGDFAVDTMIIYP